MVRINTMVSVAVSLFAFFALASQVQAQEAQTQPEGLVPHQVVRGERMRSPFRMDGTRHPGLLLEHGNISINEFVHLHPNNGRGRGVGLRTCRIPRSERRMEVDGQRTTAPCPPSARVRIWYLLPGATIYLPPRDATAPAITQHQPVPRTAPPQPRPERVRRPVQPRVRHLIAPAVIVSAPIAPAALGVRPTGPTMAQQEQVLRANRYHRELNAARKNNRVLQKNLNTANEQVSHYREQAGGNLPIWQRDGFWPTLFLAFMGFLIVSAIGYLLWEWRRKKRLAKATTHVMRTIARTEAANPQPDAEGRATEHLPEDDDARNSVNPDDLERIVKGWGGYNPDISLNANLQSMAGAADRAEHAGRRRQAATTATEASARQDEAGALRTEIDSARTRIKSTLGTDPGTEPTLPELLDALITDRHIADRRLVEEVFGKPENGETAKERLTTIRLERIRLQTANNELAEESKSNAAILREHSDELIAENQRLQDLLGDAGRARSLAEEQLAETQGELTFLRINAQFRASTPVSLQPGPRALATDAPPPPAPPAPSQSPLAALAETGEHVLRDVTASHYSANPPPPPLELEEDSAAAGDSLPPLADEDTHPRGSLLDLAAAAATVENGIDLGLAGQPAAKPTGSRLPPKKRDTDKNFPSPVPSPPAVANPGQILRRGSRSTAKGPGSPPPPPSRVSVVGDRNAPKLPQTMCPPRPPGDGADFAVGEDGIAHPLKKGGNGADAPVIPDLTALAEDAGTGSLMAKGLRMSGIGMDSQAPPADASADAHRPSIFEDEEDADSDEATEVGERPVITETSGDSPPPKNHLH